MLRLTITRSAPRKIKASDVKHAIQHAQNLCFNFENTPECRSAWELVDELSEILDIQKEGASRRSLNPAVDEESHISAHKLRQDILGQLEHR